MDVLKLLVGSNDVMMGTASSGLAALSGAPVPPGMGAEGLGYLVVSRCSFAKPDLAFLWCGCRTTRVD